MKRNISLVALIATLLLGGCATIKSAFPDKEKNYRYTSEIPPLVLPSDLQAQTAVPEAPPLDILAKPALKPQESGALVTTPLAQKPLQAQPLADKAPAEQLSSHDKSLLDKDFAADVDASEKAVTTEVSVINESGQTPQLRINQNLARSWRIVGKALTRQTIEITERNIEQHYFRVQYDPEAKPMADVSFWDELDFIFGSEKNLEQIYRIQLTEQESQTFIKVLNHENQPCNDEKCAKLFNYLHELIQKSLQE